MFTPTSPIDNAGGTILTFYLMQNHGGGTSDDNENNNLGRFRLSITTRRMPMADPLPAECARFLPFRASSGRRSKRQTVFQLLADDGPGMGRPTRNRGAVEGISRRIFATGARSARRASRNARI